MPDSAPRAPGRVRTPPLPKDAALKDNRLHGLGFVEGTPPSIKAEHDYDLANGISDSPLARPTAGGPNLLSPTNTTFLTAGGLSPPGSMYTPATPPSASTDGSFPSLSPAMAQTAQAGHNPFNFTSVPYTAGNAGAAVRGEALGKRKGHKYRHSSVHASAMDSIIQAPMARTPLAVPASLPMPTRGEAWRSLTANQRSRLSWCLCHFLVAGYVQFSSGGSLSMTALSRLLLFDAAGATACVAVDVMGNFEVWKRSSIKHPFGLERADVLAGFGMAVFITFMGLDVISHGIEHSLENLGSHEPHTSHDHERVTAGRIDIASLLAIASTLVSAILLKNHTRIGKATQFSLIAGWGRILGNPSHVLTLSCSILLLILPLLNISTYNLFDLVFSMVVAALMIAFGARLGASLASMLLMSYNPPAQNKSAVREVLHDIETDPAVSGIEEARFWQVHYGLCMANLKLRYRSGGGGGGCGDEMVRIRQRITSLIRQRLGGKWEVSMQMNLDKD